MASIFSFSKRNDERKAKEAILREFFNSADQKKAIEKAAKESAKDQRIMIDKYRKLASIER